MQKTIININDPVFQKAIFLAEAYQRHCLENNLPDTLVIENVAHNSGAVSEASYIKGKKYEKERMATLLGLNEF